MTTQNGGAPPFWETVTAGDAAISTYPSITPMLVAGIVPKKTQCLRPRSMSGYITYPLDRFHLS